MFSRNISLDELRNLDIARLFSSLSNGDTSMHAYAYDELPYFREYPPEWGPILIEASQATDVKLLPESYFFLCALILVKIDSKWVGMPDLIVKVLGLGRDLPAFELARDYIVRRSREIAPRLRAGILSTYEALPFWKKSLYWLDGPTRELLNRCRAGDNRTDQPLTGH